VFFEATCARRQGRLLSKAQRDRARVRGLLLIDEQRDPELMRVVRVARLVEKTTLTTDVLPPLHDAQVVAVRPGWWTINRLRAHRATAAGRDGVLSAELVFAAVPLSTQAERHRATPDIQRSRDTPPRRDRLRRT
jgi:hypothetical protein